LFSGACWREKSSPNFLLCLPFGGCARLEVLAKPPLARSGKFGGLAAAVRLPPSVTNQNSAAPAHRKWKAKIDTFRGCPLLLSKSRTRTT
jgi:hypothetical protein